MNRYKMNLLQATGRAILLGGTILALSAGSAYACSLANWSTTTGADTIIANQPNGASGDPATNSDNVRRYEGKCASKAPAGIPSYVQDNRPGGIDRIIARFYVFNDGATNPVVYRGNDSGGNELFDVTLTGGIAVFDAGGGVNVSDTLQNGWNSIEIDWDSASGNISMIVNGEDAVTNSGISAASLANVQLGNVDGVAGGDLYFDSYEAHLSTQVGRLCRGDTDASNDRGLDDIFNIAAEFGAGSLSDLASGTPDFDESGDVGLDDIFGVFELFADGLGECP
mgnify:CR=1 FL=1